MCRGASHLLFHLPQRIHRPKLCKRKHVTGSQYSSPQQGSVGLQSEQLAANTINVVPQCGHHFQHPLSQAMKDGSYVTYLYTLHIQNYLHCPSTSMHKIHHHHILCSRLIMSLRNTFFGSDYSRTGKFYPNLQSQTAVSKQGTLTWTATKSHHAKSKPGYCVCKFTR